MIKNLVGLIIVNHNCSFTNLVEKYVEKIMSFHNSSLLISKNVNDLQNKIDSQDFVVIFGGDGTVFSSVQHLIGKNIAIVHFPNGTGNGLTNSLLYQKNMKIEKNLEITYEHIFSSLEEFKISKIDTMKIKMLNSGKLYYIYLLANLLKQN